MSEKNPTASVPEQGPDNPLGDRGQGDKTWSPEQGEQGISNRVGDEDSSPESDPDSFGHGGKKVASLAEDDPAEVEDDDFDDADEEGDEDDEDEDEEGDIDESPS